MSTESKELVTSPCVGNCCLDNNDMCVGCFRLMDEILNWAQADVTQKKKILLNSQNRRNQVQVS